MAQLPAAATIDDHTLDRMPARGKLLLESLDEDTEVGRRRRRVHLRDEQDAHRRII
jgi:hypothetical protein